jgi:hypothetical protein
VNSSIEASTDRTDIGKEQTTTSPLENGEAVLPCLNSNISIEIPNNLAKMSTQHRKTAFVLKESVQLLANRFGVEFLGFLTLTFSDHVTCHKEAQKRLNSLLSNVIKPRYQEYVGCMERQKSGRIHYHLLVVLKTDIRTDFDFTEIAQSNYKSASKNLRDEWSFWRKTARKYRFGRTELLPIKSTIEAMAKYVGKYISKHMENRNEEDKGARLVRYSRGARAGTTRFMFKTDGSEAWRRKVAVFAQMIQEQHPEQRVSDLEDLRRVLGPTWAYRHRELILDIPV